MPRVTVRHLLFALALPLWAYGLVRFIGGEEILGGSLMLIGGLLVVVAASGGWGQFFEGLTNWLWGIGR